MKLFALAIVVAAAAAVMPSFASDVGVSISVGQPGFYGQLDIGDYPPPQVIYRRPIIIERGVRIDRPPMYLRVPPGHAKHWSKHCGEYNACGERVYFVQDKWYNREYVPRYQADHRDGRSERRDDRRDNQEDSRHGNDRGRSRNH